jgi:RNA polymerase sigma-70 factor (ECF subfamily)
MAVYSLARPWPFFLMAQPDTRPLTQLDDATLVAECVAGTAGAFDLVVDRYRRPIYQLCYRFVGRHEDASDLTQDVFLRAFRGLKSFRGQAALSTWLYRIAVNVCLNRVGVKRPLDSTTDDPIDAQELVDLRSDSPAERLLRAERSARVRAAIARLPAKQRATLILRTYHELSHQEIADVLGSSVGAVKANFFHALANLKKMLETEGGLGR